MHVCLLSEEWPPHGGGIGSYMFNLARGLVSAGHRVTVITHDREPVVCSGAHVISIPSPDCRRTISRRAMKAVRRILWGIEHPWSWEAYRVFQEVMKADPIDIIETAEFGAWGWHFLQEDRVPIVVRCHNPTHVVWSANQTALETWGLPRNLRKQDKLERGQTHRAGGITSPSHALAYHLSLGWTIPLTRFAVIPNPIDAELFCPGDAGEARTEILYVGRLEYNKGVYDLAEALVPILKEYPGVSVRFVGMDRPTPPHLLSCGKSASDVIRSMVPERFGDRLLFTTHVAVTEVIRLQQKALLAVVPTRGFENFPYTVLEAMACGTPVVATRCGGPEEIVTDEVDGLLVPPGRPTALTEAMRRLLDDPPLRTHLGTRGRQTVEARFSIPAVLPRIVDWYSDAIRGFNRERGTPRNREDLK